MNAISTEPPRLTLTDRDGASMKRSELETLRKIEESMAFMIGHLDTPLRVSTLAAQVNLSPSHYFALFRRHVGSSPINYFIRLRLQRAGYLLENTNMSIKAVAYAVGYDDPFYFSRIFKAFSRVAPSQYRHLKLETRGIVSGHCLPPLPCADCLQSES